jgi:hypothetical protein
MPRRFAVPICAVLLGSTLMLSAQEPAYQEDLRFVEQLRKRKDSKLALELLQKLKKGAPPALARELMLEEAKTRLEAADEEPDSATRLKLYQEARAGLRQFIAKNPTHPRVAEANLDIARLLNLQGKTELSRALMSDDKKTREAGEKRARATLEDAHKRLEAAAVALEKRRGTLPDPDSAKDKAKRDQLLAQRRRLDERVYETKLDLAMNLYSQWQTGNDAKLQPTVKALQALADASPANSPVRYKALAWLGRCQQVTETSSARARATYAKVLDTKAPAAAEGRRLAGYFQLLLTAESPLDEQKKDLPAILVKNAEAWRKSYPRFHRTPEGFGVSFLLAKTYVGQASNPKLKKPDQDLNLARARLLLSEIDSSENEFTEQARRLKLTVLERQGAFTKKVAQLNTFEECYVRAEYEIGRLRVDKGKKERDEHVATLIAALTRALSRGDAKKQPPQQLHKARLTLAYWCLVGGKLREAIEFGEGLAREAPNVPQAPLAAAYALEAYSRLIGLRKAASEDVAEERAGMFRLARYMEERWPGDLAGDMARYEIGLLLVRDGNLQEAIKKLSGVTPGYANLARARALLAYACTQAEKESLPPIIGDRTGDYRRRSRAAMASIPESVLGSDPETNTIYVGARAVVLRELFPAKRYAEMEEESGKLLARLPGLRFSADGKEDQARRADLRDQFLAITLSARWGLADAAFAEGDHARVLDLLSPLVAKLGKSEESPEKSVLKQNRQLAGPLLALAMKSSIQLNKTAETEAALEALDAVSAEEGGSVMKQLAFLIRQQVEELRKKGDKAALAQATKAFTAILDKRIAKQKPDAEFLLVLADCYSSMGQHGKAAGELGKVVLPKKAPAKGSDEEKLVQTVSLRRVRELRLSKTKANLKKASEEMQKILGTPKEPGWGRRSLSALKENGLLLEEQEQWKEAFGVWKPLVTQLARKASEPRLKETYLECYYHMVLCYYKYGQTLGTKVERLKYARGAAQQALDLEKSWEGFGSDASKKRFEELFGQETTLREQYQALKKGR